MNSNSKPSAESKSRPKKVSKKTIERMTRKKANNPPTPYGLFIRDIRRKVNDHPIGLKELTLYCNKKWKAMTAEQKKRYQDLAKVIRERMRQQFGQSQRRYNPDIDRKLTNYFNFTEEVRPSVTKELRRLAAEEKRNLRPGEVVKEIGRRWSLLTPEQKKEYQSK